LPDFLRRKNQAKHQLLKGKLPAQLDLSLIWIALSAIQIKKLCVLCVLWYARENLADLSD